MTHEVGKDDEMAPVIFDPADGTNSDQGISQNKGCRNAAIGCGVAAVLIGIVGVIVAVVIALNWRTFLSNFTVDLAAQAVDQMEIPQEDKARIRQRLNGLADDFKAGRLSKDQIGRIIEKVVASPLIVVAVVTSAENHYVKPSGLTDDEKQAAHRTLERLARGIFESKINQAKQDEVMQLVMQEEGGQRKQLKQKMTDDELRAFLAKSKEAADEAEIPDERFEIDIADEFEKAIDAAMQQP